MKGANWKDTVELVGIGAIVASLIFVGLQMRQEQEIARAQALGDYIAGRIDYLLGMTEYSDILVKANSGAQLDAVEEHTLRNLVQLTEDHAFLEVLRQSQLGGDLKTAELTFVSFLYRNPAARTTWLQIADDMERYVDPLRTTESLARTRASGSSAFRSRVKAHLAKLDTLYDRTKPDSWLNPNRQGLTDSRQHQDD